MEGYKNRVSLVVSFFSGGTLKYVYELMMKREGETKREREIDSGRQICGREPGAIERERERDF